MKYIYKPIDVCSKNMIFDIEDNIVKNVVIEGGCAGNLLAITYLIKNKTIDEVIELLQGVPCGHRNTSCPDQIAKALTQYKEKRN